MKSGGMGNFSFLALPLFLYGAGIRIEIPSLLYPTGLHFVIPIIALIDFMPNKIKKYH